MGSEDHRLIVSEDSAGGVGDVVGRDGSISINEEDVGGGQVAEGSGAADDDEVLVNGGGVVTVPGDADGGDISNVGELDVDGSVGI